MHVNALIVSVGAALRALVSSPQLLMMIPLCVYSDLNVQLQSCHGHH